MFLTICIPASTTVTFLARKAVIMAAMFFLTRAGSIPRRPSLAPVSRMTMSETSFMTQSTRPKAPLGDCRGAEDAFAAVLTRFPQSRAYPDSLYQSALCLVEAGDGTRAGVRLDELMKQYPDYPGMPEACLTAAAIKEAGRDYRQALNLLRKVVSSGREELSGRAQLGIARLYRLMGESDRAVIEYLKIPYLYPGRTALEMEARLEAAATYAQVGSVEEALKVLRIVVDNPEAGDYRARAEELIGHLGGDPGRPAGRPPEKPSP